MATKTIAWNTGSGNITLTYTGQGNGSISVSSSENDLFEDREQSIGIVTTAGTPEKALSILVKQKGKTYPIGEVFNFAYTGSVQQITLPKGKYKLQCWGAQGGNVTGTYAVNGSKGGYSEGVLTLDKATTLYIFVGGQGTSYASSASQTSTSVVNGGWNGGGAGRRTSLYNSDGIDGRSFPRGGGGGTDIALVTSAMSYSSGRTTRDSASLLSRIIVAGGGAGASARYTETQTTKETEELLGVYTNPMYEESAEDWDDGVYKRRLYFTQLNLEIGNTYRMVCSSSFERMEAWDGGYSARNIIDKSTGRVTISYKNKTMIIVWGGVIDSSSTLTIYRVTSTTSTSTASGKSNTTMQGGGTSGKGQYPGKATSAGSGGAFGLGASQTSTNYRYCGGGGGGGWYGGGKGQSDTSTSYINYTGGGSGFVNTSANASSRPSKYTGLQLDSGTTKDGSTSFESTSGGTETGHSGNGYARITVIG